MELRNPREKVGDEHELSKKISSFKLKHPIFMTIYLSIAFQLNLVFQST